MGKHLAAEVFTSYSAGTEPQAQINPDAVRLVKERYGIDMEKTQYSKPLSAIPSVDVVITMGCAVSCPNLPCAYQEDWGLADPSEQPDVVFLSVIDIIHQKILELKNSLS